MGGRSVWDDDYRPYGTNTGSRGNPDEWRRAYRQTMGLDEARDIMGDGDAWSVLGVAPSATWKEIFKAYTTRAHATHPDHNKKATYDDDLRRRLGEEFQKVRAAYTVLKDYFGKK